MGWHYRLPQTFPAKFLQALRDIALNPEESIVLGSARSHDEMMILAEQFRWFRWCVRKEPGAQQELSTVLETMTIRAKIETSFDIYILSISGRLNCLEDFENNNPALAGEIFKECQDTI